MLNNTKQVITNFMDEMKKIFSNNKLNLNFENDTWQTRPKSFGSRQPARDAQADVKRYFLYMHLNLLSNLFHPPGWLGGERVGLMTWWL